MVRITLPEEMQTLVWGCENSVGVDMPDIPQPPKGGHHGDTGGTHSSQSKGSRSSGGGFGWGGGGQKNVNKLNDESPLSLDSTKTMGLPRFN